jgi:protein involved in polysaccharide export with SLBB domain
MIVQVIMLTCMLISPTGLFGLRDQATAPQDISPQDTNESGRGQSDGNRPVLQHRNPRYTVQSEDVLVISFPLSPEFNQTVTIQPDGYITLMSGGDLYIQGMTIPEVVEALRKSYVKILHDPIINVDLKDFQKPFFFVGGQVGKPGQFALRYNTTVAEAIAIAGGLSPAAKTQAFLYRRVSSDWFEVKELKLKDVMGGKKQTEDVRLQPGDMIIIPESFISKFRKYVPYSVTLGGWRIP